MILDPSSLWRRWIVAFTLGELVGFAGIPAIGGIIAMAATADLEPAMRALTLYAVAVIGGLGEGTVLSLFQACVLRHWWPGLELRRWVGATAAAAALAWACGMLAPTLDDLIGLSATTQIAIWLPAGLFILCSIGAAQAWAIRGLVAQPRRWLLANVLGWLAGLPWTFVLPALVPESAPPAVWAATFGVAGLLMGITVGAVTGAFLVRMPAVEPTERQAN